MVKMTVQYGSFALTGKVNQSTIIEHDFLSCHAWEDMQLSE